MNDKYEIGIGPNTHTIESMHVLCCAETGRVMAAFYDKNDLEDAIELLNKKPTADIEGLPTPKEVSLILNDFPIHQAESIAAEVYQPLYNAIKNRL